MSGRQASLPTTRKSIDYKYIYEEGVRGSAQDTEWFFNHIIIHPWDHDYKNDIKKVFLIEFSWCLY